MRLTDCRTGHQDRRRHATPLLSGHLLTGRRRLARRTEDRSFGFYTDVPTGKAVVLALFVLVLSVLDAALSLHLFDAGKAHEANPFMQLALESGELTFLLAKFGLTILGLLVICTHWNFTVFRRVRIVSLSRAIIALYTGLVAYEITLIVS